MKKTLTLFLLTLANALSAQSLVQVYNDGRLFYPENFFEKNGIATKSDISNLKKLTLGDGLLGTTYNGSAAVSTGIDFSWLLEKQKSYRQDFRLFIDTQPAPAKNSTPAALRWWTDTEIKGIDKWGNNGYFTTTIALNNSEVANMHPMITDKTPKIFYWRGDISNPAGGCWGVKGQLTNFNSSIGAIGSYGITAIWIYPSIDSTEERAVPVYIGLNTLDKTNYPRKGKGNNSSAENLAAGYKWVVWGDYVRKFLSDPETTVLCWRQTTTEGEIFNSRKLWRPVKIEYYGDFKEVK